MEDVRLGRDTLVTIYETTINNTTVTQVCPYDPNRVSLIIGSVNSGVRVSPDPNMTNLKGVGCADASRLELNIKDHGALVTRQWFGQMTSGSAVVVCYGASLNKQ